MPFVSRDGNGSVNGVFTMAQPGITPEFLPDTDPSVIAYLNPSRPATVLSQDVIAQFTTSDIVAIQGAISGNAQLMLLWYSFLAQRDPMVVTSVRFKAGWDALINILGADRMNAIAAALGVTVTP